MVLMAAASFHQFSGNIEIETAYRTLIPLFGGGAAAVFIVSFIASGVSSSVVGIMASQVIMQGSSASIFPLAAPTRNRGSRLRTRHLRRRRH